VALSISDAPTEWGVSVRGRVSGEWEGRHRAYRVDPDGKLSLIARTGMTTPLGTLTRITPALTSADGSGGIGINQQGQVVMVAQINNGPDAIVLLTPKNPAGSAAP
jgi:hypothetical protein